MDIEGLGTAICELLVNEGLIKSPSDLYFLKKDDIMAMPRFAGKSADNLITNIENSKQNDLHRLIFALGIRQVGQKAAKVLAQHFGSLDKLMAASITELTAINDIGETTAQSITGYFSLEQTKHFIEHLRNAGINFINKSNVTDSRFAGLTFVLTGTLPTLTREEASAIIESFGGKTAGSVSKKTSFVLAGEEAGSKFTKAKDLGVTIIDEEKFKGMIN
jgi:DNA ligase (NAD+)